MTISSELRALFSRCEATLLSDAIGAAALGVMLIMALHMPNLI